MKPLSIAIVGSGTSGLAAAAFLTKDGHEVTLFERFASPKPLGAGIMLQPTGLAVLACLGLDKKVLEYGAKIFKLHGQSANGTIVFDIRYNDLKPHLHGLGIHRGALFHLLHEEVTRLGIKIITSCEITTTKIENEKRIPVDKNGEERGAFYLVIDASGAKSLLRGYACFLLELAGKRI
jgi:2-polyprenyl-6-methoxyphenol hydroxylase-like FAD-dependent oxidoreductase